MRPRTFIRRAPAARFDPERPRHPDAAAGHPPRPHRVAPAAGSHRWAAFPAPTRRCHASRPGAAGAPGCTPPRGRHGDPRQRPGVVDLRRRADTETPPARAARQDHRLGAVEMSLNCGYARSGRQLPTAAAATGLENGLPAAAAHAFPKSVPPRPATYVRLIRPLHSNPSLAQAHPPSPARTQRVAAEISAPWAVNASRLRRQRRTGQVTRARRDRFTLEADRTHDNHGRANSVP